MSARPRKEILEAYGVPVATAVIALLLFSAAPLPAAGKPSQPPAGKPSLDYLAKVPLIPREKLFGNPNRAAPRISPDGKRLAYLAPSGGVLNVWVGPVDKPEAARPVTHDAKRGIRSYFWSYDNHRIVYLQDQGGNENWHVYLVDLDRDNKTTDLTPLKNVRAEIEAVSHKFPDRIMIGLNDRDPEVFDLYRLDLSSQKRELVLKNTERFADFVIDDDYRIRFGVKQTDDGGQRMFEADGHGGWKTFMTIAPADGLTTAPIGFDESGNVLYLIDSRGRNTGALAAYDLRTGREKVLAEKPRADAGSVLMTPVKRTIEAVSFDYEKVQWDVLDPAVTDDFKVLRNTARGELAFSSQSLDNRHWIVAFLVDNGPVRFYNYDRDAKKARFLFESRDDLKGLPLVRMRPEIIKSRDGLDLVSYLSLPPGTDRGGKGRPDRPAPMVLDVHGGPWARDTWGFNPEHQLWANRGYAVLSVNYRGSTGFGKEFVNAGNGQWGAKMEDDLVDAVRWAVREKIANPARVAITGGSYGGYATLEGMVEDPKVFACGVDIVGPSNLLTLLKTIPPYWKPTIALFKTRVGDYSTPAGRKLLEERSPLTRADRIERPLLIGQGANDPRVKAAESTQIVAALEKRHVPVTYVLFPDEGHGFARPPNRLAFYAVAEAFLAEHLGGRHEPIDSALAQCTMTVPAGAAYVPGLEAALKRKTTASAAR